MIKNDSNVESFRSFFKAVFQLMEADTECSGKSNEIKKKYIYTYIRQRLIILKKKKKNND